MKRLTLIAVLLLTVIVATAGNYPQPQQWEYKFEYSIRESKADELGNEGWELVAISITTGGSSVREYAFKRPKKD